MSFKCNFIGRLGADAETVTTGQTTSFISFRVAVDETFKKETTTSWIRVIADGERYKNMVQYLTKGKAVNVTGTERVSLYSTKDGQPGIDRTVRADSIEFLNLGGGGQKQEGDDSQKASNDVKNEQMTTGGVKKTKSAPAPKQEETSDDELPF